MKYVTSITVDGKRVKIDERVPRNDQMESVMNGYKAFYQGHVLDLHAETLLAAKNKAVALLRVPPKKAHMVSIVLCEKSGEQITHKTSE